MLKQHLEWIFLHHKLLVVLVKPLFVVLIHEVGKTMSEGVLCGFLNCLRHLDVRNGITPPAGWLKGLIIIQKPGIVQDWDVSVLLLDGRLIARTTGRLGT